MNYDYFRVDDFSFLSDDYHTLFKRSKASPFQNPLWLSLLYQKFITKPVIVIVKDGAKLIALFPFHQTMKYGVSHLEFADCAVSDYCDLVIDRDYLGKIDLKSVLRLLPSADILWADKVLDHQNSFHSDFKTFNKNYSAHSLPMGEDFDAWREATYDPTHRRTLDKKEGKLARKGKLVLRELFEKDEIEKAYLSLIDFRLKRFANMNSTDLVQIPQYQEFYRDYALSGAGNLARTYLYELDGVPLAVTIGLNSYKAHHIVLLTYDREKFNNWSPGLVAVDTIARSMHKNGERLLDLTIGDEPYKKLFGVTSTPIVAKILPLTFKGSLFLIAYRLASRLKRLIKFLLKR